MINFLPFFQVSNQYFLKQRFQDKNLLNATICTHKHTHTHCQRNAVVENYQSSEKWLSARPYCSHGSLFYCIDICIDPSFLLLSRTLLIQLGSIFLSFIVWHIAAIKMEQSLTKCLTCFFPQNFFIPKTFYICKWRAWWTTLQDLDSRELSSKFYLIAWAKWTAAAEGNTTESLVTEDKGDKVIFFPDGYKEG